MGRDPPYRLSKQAAEEPSLRREDSRDEGNGREKVLLISLTFRIARMSHSPYCTLHDGALLQSDLIPCSSVNSLS